MPLYEYECKSCGKHEELSCSVADRNKHLTCPACGSDRHLVMFAPGMTIIHDMQGKADLYHRRTTFRGGGAYNTTDGFNSIYYFKNNPSEDPKLIQRKMENDAKKAKKKTRKKVR